MSNVESQRQSTHLQNTNSSRNIQHCDFGGDTDLNHVNMLQNSRHSIKESSLSCPLILIEDSTSQNLENRNENRTEGRMKGFSEKKPRNKVEKRKYSS